MESIKAACPVCGETGGFRPLCEIKGGRVAACNSCGHRMLNPMPTDDELKRLYGGGYHDFWGVKEDFLALKLKTSGWILGEALKSLPGSLKGLRHLDIGCAFGYMLGAARSMGFESSGVEISPAADEAKGMGYDVRKSSVEDAGFPDEHFDLITAVDVIEHIPKPGPWLRECVRVLKKGGLIVTVTPDSGSLPARLMKCRWPHYKAEHLHYYSGRTLERLLAGAGISVTKQKVCIKYLTPAYIAAHYAEFGGRSLENRGLGPQRERGLGIILKLLPDMLLRFPLPVPSEMILIGKKAA